MNDYDDLFVDEVMRDVWARKAEVSAEYDDWKNYHKQPRAETLRPDGTPWPVASLKTPEPVEKLTEFWNRHTLYADIL